MEGADAVRTGYLGMWHDSQETRIGDIPHSARPHLAAAPNEKVSQDQTTSLPEAVAATIKDAVAEYEAGETLEARCARDADRWSAFCRPSSTAKPATNEFRAGSIPPVSASKPSSGSASPARHSPHHLSNGEVDKAARTSAGLWETVPVSWASWMPSQSGCWRTRQNGSTATDLFLDAKDDEIVQLALAAVRPPRKVSAAYPPTHPGR